MTAGEFHKMHGLGNDFVIIDCRAVAVPMTDRRARAIADRKTGIGCDQMILLEKSDNADVRMRIYNADGSEVESCGNATRCVVALIGHDCTIETAGGLISGILEGNAVSVNMGLPRFEWQDIPLAFAMDTAAMPVAWEDLESPMAVNVGNPHAIFFVPDADLVDIAKLGPVIEADSVFPQKVNVNIASIEEGYIKLHVWERGAGLTRACGTGACATAVAAIRKGLARSPVDVRLPGGTINITWNDGEPIVMKGPAAHVFTGQANWDDFG
ncbi:diaminopimelate epimerase [Sphingorhabdus arenilitoris]|uniref:Diaminopimelate epimerase n=1 Tax=Sphingorhabdus arenilitoris TaxID=1490041 RepID=A0ABV8RF04_9SPHN